MKLTALTVLLSVCLIGGISAQNPGFEYYKYVDEQDHYYDSLRGITPDTVKIPGWRSFQRWKDFWMNRVHNDATVTGSLTEYSSNLIAAYSNPDLQPETTSAFNWQLAGPSDLTTHNKGIIVSLWVDPDNIDIIYAGSNTGGMFASTNGGNSWSNVTDNIGLPAVGVTDIVVHPTNKNIKYIALTVNHHDYLSLNQPAYVYKTTDNCVTWTPVLSFSVSENVKLNRIVIDPQNPDILYALVKGKVYRTLNAGSNWEVIFNQLSYEPLFWNTNKHLLDIEFKPNDPNTVYISSNGIGPTQYNSVLTAELWMTNNARGTQVNWTRLQNGLPAWVDRIGIETDPLNPNDLFILYNESSYVKLKKLTAPLYESTTIFQKYAPNSYGSAFGGTGYWCMNIEISPSDPDIAYIAGYNLQALKMSTGTYDFYYVYASPPHPDFHVDQRIFKTVQSGTTTYLFCGNDGGVSRYNCNTKVMESINGPGLDNVQYYGIGFSPINSDFYIGGTQDNGVIGNGNNSWDAVVVGDAYETIIDPVLDNIVYCTSNGGSKVVRKSGDYGKSFNLIMNGIPTANRVYGLNDRPFEISPSDNSTLYVGYDEIFKTINGGTNWTKISDFRNLPNGKIATDNLVAIGLTEADQLTIYAAFAGPTWSSSEDNSRLFVTNDGGVNWIDLSNSVRNIIHYSGITDIHVSPEDKNKVWISFMGYGTTNRILYSENGGQNWTDISYDLPSLPVNCLNGINLNMRHRLLLGNDLGIFMYDEIAYSWENIGNGLPNSLIYDIEVNQPGRKILVATYGRGIWSTDIPCETELTNIEIEGTKVFNADYIINGNLVLKAGSVVTLKGELSFNPKSKLVIERGAKLNIEGGKFTSSCGTFWCGIEVQGNSNMAQSPTTNQGVLIINGGTIENAECGIRTWKPVSGTATPDPDYYGGLVIANDADFINNIVAVEFLPYSFKNYSNFNRCDFLTNSVLYEGKYPDYFVKLNGVSNITFKGCKFTNTYLSSNFTQWGNGIYAYDADVLIDQICDDIVIPCSKYRKSTFEGLHRGVYSLGAIQQRNTVVDNSVFKNTVRGMYFSNVDFANIKRNDFEILGEVSGLNPGGYGLYMDASTAFAIEENNFYCPLTARKGIGLVINEAGPDNNEVYNNLFQNLEYGSIAQGYNKQSGGSIDGLCYKCNDFINNGTDIRISPRNSFQVTAMDGIAYHQGANIPGNNLAPAGNTFTTTSNLKDISNVCNWIIYYRHHYGPASLLPNPADLTTNYQVFGTTYTKTGSCPSRIGTGTGKEEVKLAMEGSEALAEEAQAGLDAIVDGGSTTELHQVVISSTPDEGLALRNQLVTDSPYLSDTILKTSIIKEEVLNNAMLRDVLVSNPQAAKSAQMVEMLDNRMVPMTDEMKNEVLAGQLITSAKENLEATLSSYKHDVWVKFSTLCNLYANDTLHTWQSDTIGLLLVGANTPGTRYQLAFWQLFKGNPSAAQQVINNIPSEFTLDASEQSLHTRYSTLLNELIEFENNQAIVLEPGAAIYEVLLQLSTSGEDKPAALSRNILLSENLISYEEPIKIDDGLKSMPIYKPELKAVQSQKFRVFPNPANTFITVSWNVPGQETNTLMIHDANGRQVLTRPLQGQPNEAIVDITGFVNGTYAVILSQGGKTIATETLVIAR